MWEAAPGRISEAVNAGLDIPIKTHLKCKKLIVFLEKKF
jgi:hypothetical protein